MSSFVSGEPLPVSADLKVRPDRKSATGDQYMLWAVLALSAIGVVAVYSAIAFLAETRAGGDTESYLWQHLMKLGIAFGALAAFSRISYRWLASAARPILLASLVLLFLVQIFGVTSGGAARWLRLGPVGFQPSDIAKVALIAHIAVLLAKKQSYIKDLSRSFTPIFFWILVTLVLIGVENLSTALLILVTTALMCFVGRVSLVQLGGLASVVLLLGFLLLLASPHRAARVEAYLGVKIFPNTEETEVFSEQDEGYQARQAKIAFAMGGLVGVGPGKSTQRDFLPAPYNDFIFAIVAEEYGAIVALGLLGIFVFLLFRGFLRIARYAADPLGLFLAVGFTTMIVLYGFVHAGVATGILPVTGLPMPFISYGGTSLVATGAMMGVLLNISRHGNYIRP